MTGPLLTGDEQVDFFYHGIYQIVIRYKEVKLRHIDNKLM